MRVGTQVSILIPNRWRSKPTDPEFTKIAGITVGEPMPSQYVNKNTGAVIQSAVVEVISIRDTRGLNPNGGRCWYQATHEPVNLLIRRFGEPVVGLDVDESGSRLSSQSLWSKVEDSIADLRRRQVAARMREEEPTDQESVQKELALT